jgi:DNA-3-methyladenine glycosylase I
MSDDTSCIACGWAPASDPLYRSYHDLEWGRPVRDSLALFEKFQLDGFQAGLSWITVLRKREAMRRRFGGFDPETLARWTEAEIEAALADPGVIRSRTKIEAVVSNARIYLDMAQKGRSLADFYWTFTEGRTLKGSGGPWKTLPARTELSERISAAMRSQGFKFCGPVIVYAVMQATGMVNDHERACPLREALGGD